MPARNIDTLGGYNPDEWQMRIDKNGVGNKLKKAIHDLWDRMHKSNCTDRENMVLDALARDSPEWDAWANMQPITRGFLSPWISYETMLEETHTGLAKLCAFVSVEVTKARMVGYYTQDLFDFKPLIEHCMKLCSDTMVMRGVLDIENYDLDIENNNPSCNYGSDGNPIQRVNYS